MGVWADKLNSRKLLVTLLGFLGATLMRVADLIAADNWVTVVITLGGAYLATQAYVDAKPPGKNGS